MAGRPPAPIHITNVLPANILESIDCMPKGIYDSMHDRMQCFLLVCNLKIHMRLHWKTKPYMCSVCNACFTTAFFLRNHANFHSVSKIFKVVKCRLCLKAFSDIADLKAHMEIHVGQMMYRCAKSKCGKAFCQKTTQTQHAMNCNGESECESKLYYRCTLCRHTFPTLRALRIHAKSHTIGRMYTCKFCKRTFNVEDTLLLHLFASTNNCYKCCSCDQVFDTLLQVISHRKIHAEKRKSSCFVCDDSSCKNDKMHKSERKQTISTSVVTDVDNPLTTEHQGHNNSTHGGSIEDLAAIAASTCNQMTPIRTKRRTKEESLCPNIKNKGTKLKNGYQRKKNCSSSKNRSPSNSVSKFSNSRYNLRTKSKRNANSEDSTPIQDGQCTYPILDSPCHDEKPMITTELYKCGVCAMTFANTSNLRKHVASHKSVPLKPYQCNVCSKLCSMPYNLLVHTRTHTKEKPNVCVTCGKRFITTSDLKVHRRIHTGERPYRCTVCNKAFAKSYNLKTHAKIHSDTDVKDFNCDICHRNFATHTYLRKHTKSHDNSDKPYCCQICSKTFSKRYNLMVHTRTHTGEKPVICTTCGKGFRSSSDLNSHVRSHTGERPYKCKLCVKTFSKSYNLQLHSRTHSGELPFLCSICGKSFRARNGLQRHSTVHTGHKPYCCNECDMTFSTSTGRKVHSKSHRTSRPFKCSLCNKAFAKQKNLDKHSNAHHAKKSFKCSFCPKEFSKPYSIQVHTRTHTAQKRSKMHKIEEKPYICGVCSKSFSKSYSLQVHAKMHLMANPYKQRNLCEKTFASVSEQGEHTLIHAVKKSYLCSMCGQTFTTSTDFQNHTKQHGQVPDTYYQCSECREVFTKFGLVLEHLKLHDGRK